MRPEDCRTEIERLGIRLLEEGLALDTKAAVMLPAEGAFRRVSWPLVADAPSLLDSAVFATVEEYRRLIRWGLYSCLLIDGSLLQFTYEFWQSGGHEFEISKHRLAFVPCPFVFSQEDLAGGYTVEELLDLAMTDCPNMVKLRSSLRFDYDAHVSAHARAHLTLVSEDCRWPVFGPVSVGHFVRFVFRSFYGTEWARHDFLRALAQPALSKRSIEPLDETDLFIDCRSLEKLRFVERLLRRKAKD